MLNLAAVCLLASCLASPVTALSIASRHNSEAVPSCVLQCQAYENAQQRCLPSIRVENSDAADDPCLCDLLASKNQWPVAGEYADSKGGYLCSESCIDAEDKQALSNWLKRTCRRAGVRRQDAAAAGGAAAAAPADNAAPAAAAPADPNAAAATAAAAPAAATPAADPNAAAATPAPADANAAATQDQGQAGTENAVANDQGAVTSPAAATPTPTPTDSASASATSASQSPVHFAEEDSDKPSDWPKKNARWLAMACILVVGFTAFTIFLVWLKRRIHRKRAEERARMQEQALEAAAASSRGDAPPMGANPISPGTSGSEQQPGTNPAVKSDSDPDSITPLVGFSHAPGTRYTAYDHMLAEQQLQEEQQRQQSQSGSARSRISALFGRGPKSPQDMISGGPANGWGRPVHESPHEFDGDQLDYPAPPTTEVERSYTPRLKS